MAAGRKWSREEHLIAFNLYCQIPFGQIHKTNPRVISLANLLGRTPSSIGFKLGNFGRLDPALKARGVKGLSHGAKGEEDVWQEFADSPERLAYESEKLMAAREGRPLIDPDVEDETTAEGLDREAIVKLRVNQSFFRKRVLSAYSNTCCVTGLSYAPLLIASHIIPWAKDVANRLNPRNGLCLNALHDKAFDRGFMWMESDLTIRMSPRLFEPEEDSDGANWLKKFDGAQLCLPKHFSPDLDLLQRHAEQAKASN